MAFLFALSPLSGVLAEQYQVIDLGVNITPSDINDEMVVVATRANADYTKSALIYDVSQGVFDEINGGIYANAINNAGQVAGNTSTGAFLYSDNDFDKLGEYYSAHGISNEGFIAGSKSNVNPYRAVPRPVNPAIYDIQNNQWKELEVARLYPRGTLDGVYADLYTLMDINDNGYAVGNYRKYGLTTASGFLVTPAFDQVIRHYSSSNAINNQNIIVGRAVFDPLVDPNAHAYLYNYDTGLVKNLGTLNSGLTSDARDINEQNQVVGTSLTWPYISSLSDPDKYHAFIWEDDLMVDLNALIPQDSGWTLNIAYAINNHGDIVGTGWFDGQQHGFLLVSETSDPGEDPVPVPEAQLPVATANAQPLYGRAPLTVNFDASQSFDPDGVIVEYQWEFESAQFSSEVQPQYTFTHSGRYPVTLTVTDNDGLISQDIIFIRVRNAKTGE